MLVFQLYSDYTHKGTHTPGKKKKVKKLRVKILIDLLHLAPRALKNGSINSTRLNDHVWW